MFASFMRSLRSRKYLLLAVVSFFLVGVLLRSARSSVGTKAISVSAEIDCFDNYSVTVENQNLPIEGGLVKITFTMGPPIPNCYIDEGAVYNTIGGQWSEESYPPGGGYQRITYMQGFPNYALIGGYRYVQPGRSAMDVIRAFKSNPVTIEKRQWILITQAGRTKPRSNIRTRHQAVVMGVRG